MRAQRVALTGTLAYWTVVGDDWRPVRVADAFLRHLRLGADRAEGTTRVMPATWRATCRGARAAGGIFSPPPGHCRCS